MSDAPQGRSPRGLARDIQRAREGSQASAEELREFVRQFRGKSPQEMLGLVTGSGLIQSTAVATVLTVVFMLAFTLYPYFRYEPKQTAKAPAPAAAPVPVASPSASAAPAPAAAPVATTPAAPLPAATGAPKQPDVLDRLGIGETKTADPKKNPLEAGADDLLKDLK